MKKWICVGILTAICASLLILPWLFFAGAEVDTVQVQARTFTSYVQGTGTVAADVQLLLAPCDGTVRFCAQAGPYAQGSTLVLLEPLMQSGPGMAVQAAAPQADDLLYLAQTTGLELQSYQQLQLALQQSALAVAAQPQNSAVTAAAPTEVLRALVSDGQSVTAGTPLLQVCTDGFYIRAYFADSDAAAVDAATQVTVATRARPQQKYTCTQVQRRHNLSETAAGQAEYLLQLPQDAALQYLGESLTLQCVQSRRTAPCVRLEQLLVEEEGLYVFRIEEGCARRTRIEVGMVSGDCMEVTEGLAVGDTIAADPTALQDGQTVERAA